MSAAPNFQAPTPNFPPSFLNEIENTVMDRGGQTKGGEIAFRCPNPSNHQNGDKHPSARWNRSKCAWYCDICDMGGGALDLAQRLGIEKPERRQAPPLRPVRPAKVIARYDYNDADGNLLFQVERLDPKSFRQRRPDGQGGWEWNLKGVEPVLYHLDEIVTSDDIVMLAEGEKDCDRLRALGMIATTAPMGAGKWRQSYTDTLAGREVIILPHNDAAGREHAEAAAAQLHDAGCAVTVVPLPDLPDKGDVSDWLDKGFTDDDLAELIRETPAWKPATETLAGYEVLAKVEAFLSRFVSYPSKETRLAHTLWIAHTHLMDSWESTPRLAFLSPEPASGKTRALEITELLVPNPVEAVNVTPAYLFRKVGHEDGRPTILYDEIDTVFGPKAKDNEEIRGLLNAGHRVGAVAGRCVVKGKVVETEEIPAYCAVALAGLGEIPDTILSRSVVVRMQRRAKNEHVDAYRRRVHAPEGHAIRDQLAAWARTVHKKVADAWPEMPAGVEDRDADMWEPLLAVADASGSEWPKQARVAAVALVADSKAGTPSLGIKLLSDIRTLYSHAYVMSTEDILKELHAIPEAPWADLKGKPLDARGLARFVNKYGVHSKNIRIGDSVSKGYAREDFEDAWSRYLGPPHYESATNATSATQNGLHDSGQSAAKDDTPGEDRRAF